MQVSFWKEYKEYYKRLTMLGLPVLVTQLGIIVVSFADTMMVGHYGTDELAAAAFVNSLFVVVTVMQIGFASGLTPLVGALFGRGETHRAGRMLRAGLEVNILVSASFTLIMGILYFFLDRFGQPVELLPLIRKYYLIILASLLPMAVFNSFQQTCNGITDTRTPMWFILGANVLNIVGNYALIYGHWGMPEAGLAGAGFSTLTARIVAALGIAIYFIYRRTYRPYREGFAAAGQRGSLHREVWATSYPVMIQSGVECSLWTFGAIVCGWYGKIQLAAYQVVTTISQLGFMIYMSFSTALSILVANFTGREAWLSVRHVTIAGLHLILALATLSSIVFLIFGHTLIASFTPDIAVEASAAGLILPLVVYQYMDAVQLTYCNAIRGTSHVQPLLWIALGCYVGIGAPVLLWFAGSFTAANMGIYWSFCIALGAAALLLSSFFYRIVGKEERGVYAKTKN
ncbi:MAG: MATE family efflux transporter [Muribaculaceae bacterium]|nr:MATE family efflux transporter [Muribaculaceae bacterium]